MDVRHYDRIVLGLTTVPRRVPDLAPVLDSISAQTLHPDTVYISVSKYSDREKRPYPIDELKAMCDQRGFVVNVIDRDYGPLTKLMGMLLVEPMKVGTLIITVDDDHVLHPDTVETIVRGAERYPGDVVALNGARVDMTYLPHFYTAVWVKNSVLSDWMALREGDQLNLVMGYGGVGYPRSVFGTTIPDGGMEAMRIPGTPQTVPSLHTNDDLYISAWLGKLGVRKTQIRFRNSSYGHLPLPQSFDHALCAEGESARTNSSAVNHMKKWLGLVRTLQQRNLIERNGDMDPVPLYKDITLVSLVSVAAVLTLVVGGGILLHRHRK